VAASPSALLRLARPRQWVKNAFVAAPLFFTPEAINAANLGRVALAVAIFCLLASAIYAFNDWCDREADRQHPKKRTRPIASGAVSPAVGLAFSLVLLAAAAGLTAAFMPQGFAVYAALYALSSTAYSLWLKHISVLDVMLVAIGFVLRVDAGSAAIGVAPTVWIVICTFLLALFMALAKRRDDLAKDLADTHRPALAGYNLRFVDAALAVVLAALLVSYLIYTTNEGVIRRYGTDQLYLTAPFVTAGVLRYLQVALVEERSGSPTDLALTDRFLILAVVGWIATFAFLMYGAR
jgi:decaprenyl-phosphate phosphoribosyltransferase